jgi:hypothetical protein
MPSERVNRAFQSTTSVLTIERPAPGVVVVTISGTDVGEHGDAPFAELVKDVEAGPFELFVDARQSRAVALDVSGSWARWLKGQRASLRRVNMLTGSRFVALTANFVRDFAELGDLMRVYADPVAFDDALSEAAAAGTSAAR